jgi:hypothetical protein
MVAWEAFLAAVVPWEVTVVKAAKAARATRPERVVSERAVAESAEQMVVRVAVEPAAVERVAVEPAAVERVAVEPVAVRERALAPAVWAAWRGQAAQAPFA